MLRTYARRGVVGGTALLVGLAGLTVGQEAAHAAPPLPVDQAGPVAFWGPGDTTDGFPVPTPGPDQVSEAFTKVVANNLESAIGLTADGRVELIGTNNYAAQFPTDVIPTIPAGETVVDIAGDSALGSGMAVTSAGHVYAWGTPFNRWYVNLPTDLPSSKAVAISANGNLAAVVKQDGSVLVWGSTTTAGDYGQLTPQEGLTGVASVFFSQSAKDVYALKSDGTLVAWGDDSLGQTDLPAVTTDATDDVNVTDLTSIGSSEVALLSNGTLVAWGPQTGSGGVDAPPETTEGKDIVALTSAGSGCLAVDATGQVYTWGESGDLSPAFAQLPAGLDPANITGLSGSSYFVAAIQATYGYVDKPTVSGTAKVGEALTATHATFTADPDTVTGQWLANGAPISGATATTYTLTAAEVGKTITYSETATRGTESATAVSDPTAAVAAASTGGGNTITPAPDHHQQLAQDQAQLQKAQTKLKKAKKALKKAKKAHNAKKAKKLKKKVKKLKKQVKKDKKLVQADQ